MIVEIPKDGINDAVALAEGTYATWKNRSGHYPNLYNSHLKGKLGEIATEILLKSSGIPYIPRFRNSKEQALCDLELLNRSGNTRLEVKTWSLEHWLDQGRCVKVEQLAKLRRSVDALVWWVVDLPAAKEASDLDQVNSLSLTFMGWSTVDDVEATTPRLTGWRKINNYQVEQANLRPLPTLIA